MKPGILGKPGVEGVLEGNPVVGGNWGKLGKVDGVGNVVGDGIVGKLGNPPNMGDCNNLRASMP